MAEELPRTLPRDVPDCHERQAVDFRALASTTTIARVKTRLLREAEEHEQTACGEPVLVYRAVQIQATRRRKNRPPRRSLAQNVRHKNPI